MGVSGTTTDFWNAALMDATERCDSYKALHVHIEELRTGDVMQRELSAHDLTVFSRTLVISIIFAAVALV